MLFVKNSKKKMLTAKIPVKARILNTAQYETLAANGVKAVIAALAPYMQ